MELIYNDKYYDSPEYEEGKYTNELLIELQNYASDIKTRDIIIHQGADWPVVLVDLFSSIEWTSILKASVIPGVFFLGKKINENLEAWVEIGKKLKKIFKKNQPARIDEQAAFTIALNDMINLDKSIIIDEVILKIHNYNSNSDIYSSLKSRPDSLYLFEITTHKGFFVYAIRSDGKISFKYKFGNTWNDFLQESDIK